MPTKIIEVQQTQKQLKELLTLVVKGTEIVLTQGNTPIARLVPIAASAAQSRVAGLHVGAIWMSDDFDEPLPDEFWLGGK
jgi:prevent-host-death family protein